MTNRLYQEEEHLERELYIDDIEVVRDLSRVWSGCYVELMGEQWEITSVRVDVEGDILALMACRTDYSKESRLVSLDYPELHNIYPSLGYFNAPTTAVYLSRTVSRQWRQGLHANNVRVTVPFDSLINRQYDAFSTVGLECMYSGDGLRGLMGLIRVYNPTYPDIVDTLDRLRGSDVPSIALSREIALALHPLNGEVHVLYHEESVGAVDDSNELVIKDGFFWLEDTLREVIHA